MKAWQDLLKKALHQGAARPDRTGVGTFSLFGESFTVDNRTRFPAVTTKELKLGQVAAELACFLRGYESLEQFHKMGCTIWDGNGNAGYWKPRFEGDLGRIYGVQWRDWRSVTENPLEVKTTDQLLNLVDGLIKDPFSRRHLVTAYNPGELCQMCLPPCHVMFQCYVAEEPSGARRIDMLVYMRSVDLFLGLPFDIASYAILQRLLAQTCTEVLDISTPYVPGFLTFFLGDAHIYANHVEQVHTVLHRVPFKQPHLRLPAGATVFNFEPAYARLDLYAHHGFVPAPLNI